jgi:DNA-binding GntR family transcriptional regulator
MPSAPRTGAAGRQVALDALRKAITDGDMSPGQRLVEAELAEMYHVTRASVRAALIDLTGEGLVERIPNRGARVKVVPVEEAVAITECRMVLEGLCASKAAERASDEEIGRLTDLAAQLREAVADGELMKYSELNHELHRMVREMSGQAPAAELLERLQGQLVRHQFRLSLRAGRPQVSVHEHLAIVEAIADRDPERARDATYRHLGSVIEALRETSDAGHG